MAARRREPEHKKENQERWLLTYADLITLLMIFFVMMYTISNVNAQKFQALASSLNSALSGQGSGGSIIGQTPGPSLAPGQSGAAQGEMDFPPPDTGEGQLADAQEQLQDFIGAQGLKGQVTADLQERGLVVSFQDTVLFASGSADLTPSARTVMQEVGQVLRKLPNYIRVEGHTDSRPIHTAQFPSNWELSVRRATSVVHQLVESSGIDPRKLSAIGYGEFRPVAPNTSAENMSRNRRVDIIIMNAQFNPVEPQERQER